jgi:DNA-directed RNA polymerase specialized sigma24 family protein
MAHDSPFGVHRFPATHWSLVDRAGHASDALQRKALGELLQRYLPALRSHLVMQKRIDPDRADDLLQEFLVAKVIEKELIGAADRERGRFRSFLLVSLDRFILSEFRRERAQKRSAPNSVPISDETGGAADFNGPDAAFDIAWARQLLDHAIETMRTECQCTARADIWAVFKARILDPLLLQADLISYETLVEKYGLTSPAKASNLLITGRRMFVRVLRDLIGQYEKDQAEIDAEIDDLYAALEKAAHGSRVESAR